MYDQGAFRRLAKSVPIFGQLFGMNKLDPPPRFQPMVMLQYLETT
jgi:hypothetical protein